MSRSLGKITRVSFGTGGYQDAMFGFSFSFDSSEGWSITDWKGVWSGKPSASAKWTEKSRDEMLCSIFLEVRDIMIAAKVDDFNQLVGKPVELITEGNLLSRLSSWRILREVL